MSMNACCRRHGEKEGSLLEKKGIGEPVPRTLLHTLGWVVAVGVVGMDALFRLFACFLVGGFGLAFWGFGSVWGFGWGLAQWLAPPSAVCPFFFLLSACLDEHGR